ncbi:hypothetical protein [Spirosoma fluminis]
MATRTQQLVGRPDPNNPGQPLRDAQGRLVLYIVPRNTVLTIGQAIDPQGRGWERYYGPENELSTDCAQEPVPVTGAPVWGNVLPPGFLPGFWKWIVPLDAATAASGQSIVNYIADVWPQYLAPSYTPEGNLVMIGDNVPAGAVPVFTLEAVQSDGKKTAKTFTIQQLSVNVYMHYRYYASERRIVVRVGADSSILPYVNLKGPSGWTDTGIYQMQRFNASIGAKDYFFVYPNYLNPVSGQYTVTTHHQGVDMYGQLPIDANVDSEGVVNLTTELPAPVLETTPWGPDDSDGPDLVDLPAPQPVGSYRWKDLPYSANEGGAAIKISVEEKLSDGSWRLYPNPGLSAPGAPAGVGFITPTAGEFKANANTIGANLNQTIRATMSGVTIEQSVAIINAADVPTGTNRIDEVDAYLIQGWREVASNGSVNEHTWIFARVTGNVRPEIKYVQSRNSTGSTFTLMQPLPANSPFAASGFTHFSTFYNEQLTGRSNPFNQFLLRLPGVDNSQVLGTLIVNPSYPDGTTIQIYPQNN